MAPVCLLVDVPCDPASNYSEVDVSRKLLARVAAETAPGGNGRMQTNTIIFLVVSFGELSRLILHLPLSTFGGSDVSFIQCILCGIRDCRQAAGVSTK